MTSTGTLRKICALVAIVISVLTLAASATAAIPKKDVWYTQHYVILQDFERKLYRDAIGGRPEGLPGALLGGPHPRSPGEVPGPPGLRHQELLEREQQTAVEHGPRPDLHPQRRSRFDRLRPERQLRHADARSSGRQRQPQRRGRRGEQGRDLDLSLRQVLHQVHVRLRPALSMEDHPDDRQPLPRRARGPSTRR